MRMRVFQCLADLAADPERRSGITACTRSRADQTAQVRAMNELQDEVMTLALLADVVYGDNTRMRKASGGLGFLFKAGKGLLVKAFALNDFNGYGAAEPGVLSLEDNTLAALS